MSSDHFRRNTRPSRQAPTSQTRSASSPDQEQLRYVLPVQLHPTPAQEVLLSTWASTVRTLHLCANLMVLQILQTGSCEPAACWAAAETGRLPAGVTPPNPDAVFTLPCTLRASTWSAEFPDLKRDRFRTLLHQALPEMATTLPSSAVTAVADRVYTPFALPRSGRNAQATYGQRRYGDVLRFPTLLDPPTVPITQAILENDTLVSLQGHVLQAEVFYLPRVLWTRGDRVRGEVQQRDGQWLFFAELQRPPLFGPPTREAVGADPGLRQWLTCVGEDAAFELSGPTVGMADEFLERAVQAVKVRQALDRALHTLMEYRVISFEGTSWANRGPGRARRKLDAMRRSALPLLQEWVAAFAEAHGDREARRAPCRGSSTECSQCHRYSERDVVNNQFTCSHCQITLNADTNAAGVLRTRGLDCGVPFREPVFRYLTNWRRVS